MPIPDLGDAIPRRGNAFTQKIGWMVFRGLGWDFEGDPPNLPKMVLIGAPHTTNWDFVIGMSAAWSMRLGFHWLGKHTIFKWPFRGLLRRMGGIPVVRSASHGIVEQVVERFEENEHFLLALAPEGTRKKVERWKTGFHRIAVAAGVPIQLVILHFGRKRLIFGPLFHPTDNLDADLDAMHALFSELGQGKKPDQF